VPSQSADLPKLSFFDRLRFFLLFILLVPAFITVTPFWVLLMVLINRKRVICYPTGVFFKLFFFLVGVKVVLPNGFSSEKLRGKMIMANHQSFLDIPLIIGWVLPVSFLAKAELFKVPAFGWAIAQSGCLPVYRGRTMENKGLRSKLSSMIDKGFSYCVFPEGTRSVDGVLKKFRIGMFKIVTEENLTVQPVTLNHSGLVMNKSTWGVRRGTIEVVIHPEMNSNEGEKPSEFSDRVRNQIEGSLKPLV
jgi:1-acyl-sn-glycerol-3-phosphate acyltransferase